MTIFLCLDVETTGLDPVNDSILEIAWAFMDERLNVLGTPRSFVVDHSYDWSQVLVNIREASKVVRDMHRKSGLLEEMLASDDLKHFLDIRNLLEHDINEHSPDEPVHLTGLSVHFDMEFMKQTPLGELFDGTLFEDERPRIHHRHLDLSSVKLMLHLSGVPFEPATPGGHRAMDDVFEVVGQARIFRDVLAPIAAS